MIKKEKKKTNKILILIIAIIIFLSVLVIKVTNSSNDDILKCHNDEYDIYFYFDDNDQKVIKEKIVYQEKIDEESLGDYADNIEEYYEATYCESVFSDNSSCKIEVKNDNVVITALYTYNNLNKNILTYSNMPKSQVKKYIENAKVFKCD